MALAGCATGGPSPEAKAQLVPTGALRVAVLTSNPIIGKKEANGELSGTTPTLGSALAERAGVPVKLIFHL